MTYITCSYCLLSAEYISVNGLSSRQVMFYFVQGLQHCCVIFVEILQTTVLVNLIWNNMYSGISISVLRSKNKNVFTFDYLELANCSCCTSVTSWDCLSSVQCKFCLVLISLEMDYRYLYGRRKKNGCICKNLPLGWKVGCDFVLHKMGHSQQSDACTQTLVSDTVLIHLFGTCEECTPQIAFWWKKNTSYPLKCKCRRMQFFFLKSLVQISNCSDFMI